MGGNSSFCETLISSALEKWLKKLVQWFKCVMIKNREGTEGSSVVLMTCKKCPETNVDLCLAI